MSMFALPKNFNAKRNDPICVIDIMTLDSVTNKKAICELAVFQTFYRPKNDYPINEIIAISSQCRNLKRQMLL